MRSFYYDSRDFTHCARSRNPFFHAWHGLCLTIFKKCFYLATLDRRPECRAMKSHGKSSSNKQKHKKKKHKKKQKTKTTKKNKKKFSINAGSLAATNRSY